MTPLTQEWVDTAEEDWQALHTLFRARRSSTPKAVCFHAQQCAEKYLKARLVEAGVSFPKTHALSTLLPLVLPVEPTWNALLLPLTALEPYSVLIRYPGFSAGRDEAKAAQRNCAVVRTAVRFSLGLPV